MNSAHEYLLGPSVDRFGLLTPDQVCGLRARGIVTVAQLVDVILGAEERWTCDVAASLPAIGDGMQRALEEVLPSRILSALRSVRFEVPPLTGIAGPVTESPDLVRVRTKRRDARKKVVQTLERIAASGELPTKSLLVDHMTDVGDQGGLGSCTGWGSTACREFSAQQQLAPLFAYALAKHLDRRPDVVGSWQYYAFRGFVEFGHVRECDYPYTDCPSNLDIGPFTDLAAEFSAESFADILLDPEDMHLQPTLMKAILSGRLNDKLGPQPVSVSIAVHESFNSPSTALYGIVQIPGEDEARLGGHAMCVVGYIDGDHPDALFGQDYFVVKNSWGARWASQSPLKFPGYALIPAQYFAEPRLSWEALICIAESSPAPVRFTRSPFDWLRSAWDQAHVPAPNCVSA